MIVAAALKLLEASESDAEEVVGYLAADLVEDAGVGGLASRWLPRPLPRARPEVADFWRVRRRRSRQQSNSAKYCSVPHPQVDPVGHQDVGQEQAAAVPGSRLRSLSRGASRRIQQ